MRVVTRGWGRDCGENAVMTVDFDDGLHSKKQGDGYKPGVNYIKVKSGGEVEILAGPKKISMTGRYQSILSISKEEIMYLFAASHFDDPFNDTIINLAVAIDDIKTKLTS